MNLTLLAPDIQEAILSLLHTGGRRGDVGEPGVWRISAVAGKQKRRRRWQRIARSVEA